MRAASFHKADWRLATPPPTTLAGVAAVLRFANKIEDGGMEWPDTDMIGTEGWHYQMRATMAGCWHYIKVTIPQRRARTVPGWRARAQVRAFATRSPLKVRGYSGDLRRHVRIVRFFEPFKNLSCGDRPFRQMRIKRARGDI